MKRIYYKIQKYSIALELELKQKPEWEVLSIVGTIHEWRKFISAGQCRRAISEIASEYWTREQWHEIYKILKRWKNYHLNDMHPWTVAQEQALEGKDFNYSQACEYLKSINLYEDNWYKYGHSWLFRAIPAEELEEIKAFINS